MWRAPFTPDDDFDRSYINLYNYALTVFRNNRNDSPESVGGGITYRWINSWMFRETLEFYREIDIPVLFLHGESDAQGAVESTRYVEENLPDKPFTYVYYPEMWHQPRFYGEFMTMRRDILAWLEAEGL